MKILRVKQQDGTVVDIPFGVSNSSVEIATHNTDMSAHTDIRDLITELANRLNTIADSDDTTLDQLSEIVAYIKSNKSLIKSITTNKVNVSDIVNNLTTNVTNKPLSAAQGVVLKTLINAITVPTKVSELTNDKGYLTSYIETDPTVPAWAKQPNKPTYTASEVGALSVNTFNEEHLVTLNEHEAWLTDLENRIYAIERSAITILSGNTEPSASQGSDGDIYLVTE